MNNLKVRILERAFAHPGLTVGGLADGISQGARTEQDVRHLLESGHLIDSGGVRLSSKGLARIDSASFRNRAKRFVKGVLGIVVSVVAVVTGNWLWSLIQSFL